MFSNYGDRFNKALQKFDFSSMWLFFGTKQISGEIPWEIMRPGTRKRLMLRYGRLESALAVMGLETPCDKRELKAEKREFETMSGREILDWARAESEARLVKLK